MTDDPTSAEVSRALQLFREEVREDIRELRTDVREGNRQLANRLDRMVAADVYEANRQADNERLISLQAQLGEMRRAKADRAANRKWVIAAVLIPIGVAVLEIIITFKGIR